MRDIRWGDGSYYYWLLTCTPWLLRDGPKNDNLRWENAGRIKETFWVVLRPLLGRVCRVSVNQNPVAFQCFVVIISQGWTWIWRFRYTLLFFDIYSTYTLLEYVKWRWSPISEFFVLLRHETATLKMNEGPRQVSSVVDHDKLGLTL